MTPSIPYASLLAERLRDPREAFVYLDVALEEFEQDGDQNAFLLALRQVAEAQGGVAVLAERTGMNPERLRDALSERGNPTLDTVGHLLHGMGFRLAVQPLERKAA